MTELEWQRVRDVLAPLGVWWDATDASVRNRSGEPLMDSDVVLTINPGQPGVTAGQLRAITALYRLSRIKATELGPLVGLLGNDDEARNSGAGHRPRD